MSALPPKAEFVHAIRMATISAWPIVRCLWELTSELAAD